MNKNNNNHYFLLNGQMPKLTNKYLYYAQINNHNKNEIVVRKLKVRLDMIVYDPNMDEEMRQLTFLGFNVKIPSNNNSFTFMINKFSILATNKQDICSFIKKHFITEQDRNNALIYRNSYGVTNKHYYLKQTLELLKKL